MNIYQFIEENNLLAADAVELTSPNSPFPKHYAIYLGQRKGQPEFIANIMDGVQTITGPKLAEFTSKFQVTNIERFPGSIKQRKAVVKKALRCIGDKSYHFIFNNCEHFKNWVLHGQSVSKQVVNTSYVMLMVGGLFYILGNDSNKKNIQKAGVIILSIAIIVLLLSYIIPTIKNVTIATNSKSFDA